MRFLDLFAGIGGFRTGMEMAGHTCVGHCEIDKFADKSYRAIHKPKKGEWYASDITRVEPGELPDAEVYCFGFPCQAFSIAGHRRGFEDCRGTLFFEVMRLAKERKPKILFAENVAGLLSHENGRTFGIIISAMDELGYDVEWQVLNSKNFGVPQNRERVFIVGHFRGESRREVFPIGTSDKAIDGVSGQYINTVRARQDNTTGGAYIVEGQQYAQEVKQVGQLIDTESFGGNPQRGRVYGIDGISPSLNACGGGGLEPKVAIPVLTPDKMETRANGRRFKEDGEPMFTLTAQDRHGVAVNADGIYLNDSQRFHKNPLPDTSRCLKAEKHDAGVVISEATKKGYNIARPGDSVNMAVPGSKTRRGRVGKGVANTLETSCNQGTVTESLRIRKLTPLECWRLQGFTDEQFKKAKAVNSNSQLYKQAGNSVTVNVVYEIARRLK